MKINNTSIRGFYLYSDSDIYEDGDFVVFGNTIYVCSPKSGYTEVMGEKPYESNNFYVYLGDQLADVNEFIEFSSNGGGKDKYLSLSTLISILNIYMKGLDTSGIIGHEYELSQTENGLEVIYKINNSITEVYSERDAETVLLSLLIDKNVNHGIFKVSKNLPEIKNLVGDDGSYCILKQYSYYSGSNLIRVQELIDLETSVYFNPAISYANIYYRSTIMPSEGSSNPLNEVKDVSFISATAHSDFLARKASKLFSMYSTKMRLFDTTLDKLTRNFCFSNILLSNSENERLNEITLQNQSPDLIGYLDISSFYEFGPITLNIITEKISGMYDSNSLTVDPSIGFSQKYYLNDNLSVNVICSRKEGSSGGETITTPPPTTPTPPIDVTTTTTTPTNTEESTTTSTTPTNTEESTTTTTTPSNTEESTTTTTTPTNTETTPTPTTPAPPINDDLAEISSITIRLEGSLAANSWISSAYYRKYFHK